MDVDMDTPGKGLDFLNFDWCQWLEDRKCGSRRVDLRGGGGCLAETRLAFVLVQRLASMLGVGSGGVIRPSRPPSFDCIAVFLDVEHEIIREGEAIDSGVEVDPRIPWKRLFKLELASSMASVAYPRIEFVEIIMII